jgi:SAM-dependent methyltransferase
MAKPRPSSAAMGPGEDRVWAGAAFYSRRNLRFYDAILAFNCRAFWRCSRPRLVELYDEHVTARHLDIGVANGWLLDACRFPVSAPSITLMDLNPDALAVASDRLARYRPATHQASALEPFGLPPSSFDSVGLSLVLHCLPGALSVKAPVVFGHVRTVLAPGGVMFGATQLNGGVPHTPLSRWAMHGINRRGDLDNLDDNLEDLEAALAAAYREHDLRVRGAVALFAARL